MRNLLSCIFLIFLVLGCSSPTSVLPPFSNLENVNFNTSIGNARSFLGFYRLSISADRSEVDITLNRAGSIHLNALRLIEVEPCDDCLSIEDFVVLGGGRVQVTIELRHPYSAEFKKLTAFDVRGIVMLPGSYTFPEAGVDAGWEDNGDPVLVGPDGYTRLFNPLEFPEESPGPAALNYITGNYATSGIDSVTLNPYLLFAEDEVRHHFAPNTTHSRTFDLKLPPGPIELGYAVDCSWELIDGTVENIPDDFPISSNSAEAHTIWVSIGKGLTPTGTGIANLRVDVFDWQGVDTISSVLVECPALFDGELEASLSTVDDEDFIFYTQIQNEKLAPIGDYPLLVTVEDKFEDANLGPVAAYQVATAHVTLTGVWLRELVLIPAGDFIMGGDPAVDPQVKYWEEPQHDHWTDEYYIGKYELTNEEFMAFITDGGYENPSYWSDEGWDWKVTNDINEPVNWGHWKSEFGPQFPDHPAWYLRFHEAEAVTIWAGGRLPTEAEWEKASRGTDGRIFPWGNEWDASKCWNNHNGWGPLPVGSFSPEGDSPFGLADTIGNASEWCGNWFNVDIYSQYATGDFTLPDEPSIPDAVNLRGGNFAVNYASGDLRCSDRGIGLRSSINGGNGFRIVFDP